MQGTWLRIQREGKIQHQANWVFILMAKHSFRDLLFICAFKSPSGLEMKQDKNWGQEDSKEVVYLMNSG